MVIFPLAPDQTIARCGQMELEGEENVWLCWKTMILFCQMSHIVLVITATFYHHQFT